MKDTETENVEPNSCENMLLNPEQLGRVLNVTRRTLSKWTTRGIIPMLRVGRTCRFDLEKVRAALAKFEQPVAGN